MQVIAVAQTGAWYIPDEVQLRLSIALQSSLTLEHQGLAATWSKVAGSQVDYDSLVESDAGLADGHEAHLVHAVPSGKLLESVSSLPSPSPTVEPSLFSFEPVPAMGSPTAPLDEAMPLSPLSPLPPLPPPAELPPQDSLGLAGSHPARRAPPTVLKWGAAGWQSSRITSPASSSSSGAKPSVAAPVPPSPGVFSKSPLSPPVAADSLDDARGTETPRATAAACISVAPATPLAVGGHASPASPELSTHDMGDQAQPSMPGLASASSVSQPLDPPLCPTGAAVPAAGSAEPTVPAHVADAAAPAAGSAEPTVPAHIADAVVPAASSAGPIVPAHIVGAAVPAAGSAERAVPAHIDDMVRYHSGHRRWTVWVAEHSIRTRLCSAWFWLRTYTFCLQESEKEIVCAKPFGRFLVKFGSGVPWGRPSRVGFRGVG